jgi:hypothetical protein
MKKGIQLSIAFLFLFAFIANSQRNSQRKRYTQAFDQGMVVLDLHTSFVRLKSSDAFSQKQPIFFNAELGVRSDVGIGVLGGWSQRQTKESGKPAATINNYYYGLKLNMHLTRWIKNQMKLHLSDHKQDIYVSVWAGRNTEEEVNPLQGGGNFGGTTTIYGALAGVKIYSKYNVGLMLEAGFGAYGLLNAGVCYKF